MSPIDEKLLKSFREDHAILGRGFYELATFLRDGDVDAAARTARRIDDEAGAHIAFEEEEFYPRLRDTLGPEALERMYDEHEMGLGVIRALTTDRHRLGASEQAALIEDVERMNDHIAHCGTLVEALGELPLEEQRRLHEKLLEWRRRRPSWTARALQRP